MKMTKRLIDYIKKEHLSFEIISNLTGISLEKLQSDGKIPLDASELCILCDLLHIKPEDFYEKQINKKS